MWEISNEMVEQQERIKIKHLEQELERMKREGLERIRQETKISMRQEKITLFRSLLHNVFDSVRNQYEWRSSLYDFELLKLKEPKLIQTILNDINTNKSKLDNGDDNFAPFTNMSEMKSLTPIEQSKQVVKYGILAKQAMLDIVAPLYSDLTKIKELDVKGNMDDIKEELNPLFTKIAELNQFSEFYVKSRSFSFRKEYSSISDKWKNDSALPDNNSCILPQWLIEENIKNEQFVKGFNFEYPYIIDIEQNLAKNEIELLYKILCGLNGMFYEKCAQDLPLSIFSIICRYVVSNTNGISPTNGIVYDNKHSVLFYVNAIVQRISIESSAQKPLVSGGNKMGEGEQKPSI